MRARAFLTPAAALTAMLFAATPAMAHHSFSMFDGKQCRQISGVVRMFEWTYPHSWLWINADDKKAKGGVSVWGFEGGAPGDLNRMVGFQKSWIKPGDKVTVWFNPMRNGKNGGFASVLKFADGRTLQMLPSKPCAAMAKGA